MADCIGADNDADASSTAAPDSSEPPHPETMTTAINTAVAAHRDTPKSRIRFTFSVSQFIGSLVSTRRGAPERYRAWFHRDDELKPLLQSRLNVFHTGCNAARHTTLARHRQDSVDRRLHRDLIAAVRMSQVRLPGEYHPNPGRIHNRFGTLHRELTLDLGNHQNVRALARCAPPCTDRLGHRIDLDRVLDERKDEALNPQVQPVRDTSARAFEIGTHRRDPQDQVGRTTVPRPLPAGLHEGPQGRHVPLGFFEIVKNEVDVRICGRSSTTLRRSFRREDAKDRIPLNQQLPERLPAHPDQGGTTPFIRA